jgi:hypothetical protein
MDFEFGLIFNNVGWENAWELNEHGCMLLTIEFLCTLQSEDTEVSFRLFNKELLPSWKNFSRFLGFLEQCAIYKDAAINYFDRTRFWEDISKEVVCHRPRTDELHHPTLQFFLHKWLSFTLFSWEDFRVVRIEKLKLLYAMIKKKKVYPIKLMMHYWLSIPGLKGGVWCTSWVTRLVRNLGLLANANITYITPSHWIINYVYFNKAHMIKRGKNGKTVMMYKDYINEFEMPDRNLSLYVVESFFLFREERIRASQECLCQIHM